MESNAVGCRRNNGPEQGAKPRRWQLKWGHFFFDLEGYVIINALIVFRLMSAV